MNTGWNLGRWLGGLATVGACVGLMAIGITEEVPRGGVDGVVVMSENGKPLPNAQVYVYPLVPDEETDARNRYVTTDDQGRFRFPSMTAGYYKVSVSARAHTAPETLLTVKEGERARLPLTLAPSQPYLDLHYSTHTFTPDEAPAFQLTGFSRDEALDVELFRIDLDQVPGSGGYAQLFYGARQSPDVAKFLGERARSVLRAKHPITMRDAEGVYVEKVGLEPMAEGVYWLQVGSSVAQDQGRPVVAPSAGTYLLVTRMAMVTKSSLDGTRAYVTDIVSGKPIAGVAVNQIVSGEVEGSGTSDADGFVSLPPPTKHGETFAIARKGESAALVNYWNGRDQTEGVRSFFYTDRPLYRPGDVVEFKGLVRRLVEDRYVPMPPTPVTVTVTDPREEPVQTQNLTTTGAGSYYGSFQLPKSGIPGAYGVKIVIGGNTFYESVSIASYRKPEMKLSFASAKETFIRGERGEVTLSAEYFFGGPVVGAKVSCYIMREDAYGGGWDGDMGAGDTGGELAAEVEGTTDEHGRFRITFPTRSAGDVELRDVDSTFTVSAYVAEPGGRSVDGQFAVLVTRGEYRLEVEPQSHVASAGERVPVVVRTMKHGDGAVPVADREVRVVATRTTWHEGRRFDREEGTFVVRTNASGEARISVPVSGDGSVELTARTRDDRGNEIETHAYVWAGDVGWGEGEAPDLRIVLDQNRYKIGDSAVGVIQTARPGGYAWVTVEADRVLSSRLVELKGPTTRIELDVERRFSPNAYVSVAYVRQKSFQTADAELAVDATFNRLTVSVESDKAEYRPRDVATFVVTTKDDQGRPVAAEFSIGVVDEAIYALREDRADPLAGFYPKRYSAVNTSYSFPDIYLDSDDKGPVNDEMRRDFRDTAYWNPVLETDANGTATVKVRLPDNLTGWRATVVAITPECGVGKSKHTIQVRKPVMVRLQQPTFMTVGDVLDVGAVVMNETDGDRQLAVTLDGSGITVERPSQTVNVPKRQSRPVVWRVTATRAGPARFTVRATGGTEGDGMEVFVPIRPFGKEVRSYHAATFQGQTSIVIERDPNADPATGKVVVTVAPSLATSLFSALDELVDYPYGCVEQTTSRFVPLVLAARAAEKLGLPPLARRADIPDMVAQGYARLRELQNESGGWGWFDHGSGDRTMTGYVLEGFYHAARAGFPPPKVSLDKGVAAARKMLETPAEAPPIGPVESYREVLQFRDQSDRAYLAYVLALLGHAEGVRDTVRKLTVSPGNADGFAMLALAAVACGEREVAAKAVSGLKSCAITSESQAHWDSQVAWGVETTARALAAIHAHDPSDPFVPMAGRYLMANRRGRIWHSTRDTALTLMAFLNTLDASPVGPFSVQVRINGESVGTVGSRGAGLGKEQTIEVPFARLREGTNDLTLVLESGANCYASVATSQTVQQETLAPIEAKSLKVSRAYYTLEPRRMEDGTLRLGRSARPVTEVPKGTPIRVVLTIEASQPIEYAMIEDPIPSNCRAVVRYDLEPWEEWTYWYGAAVPRDDRIAFFSRWIGKGKQEIEYDLRAESVGTARALPAQAGNMYDPSVYATSSEYRFTVRPR